MMHEGRRAFQYLLCPPSRRRWNHGASLPAPYLLRPLPGQFESGRSCLGVHTVLNRVSQCHNVTSSNAFGQTIRAHDSNYTKE